MLDKEKRIKRRLKFYLVFDSIILNLYDRMEDQRKENFLKIFSEIDQKTERIKLRSLINDTI